MSTTLKLFGVCLSAFLFGFSGMAGAVDTWLSSERPDALAGGAVAFEYSGDSVSAITVTPVDGGTIWISGDEMPVAADATITFTAPGTLGFSNAVTCAGNLTVNGYGEMTRGWHDGLASTFTTAADLKASLLPTNFVTLFTDMNLDEWEPYAYYGAQAENKANPAISTSDIQLNPNSSPDSFLEFIERTEKEGVKMLRAELTFHGSAVYNVYTIEMRQNGSDVQGRLVRFVRDSSHPHKNLKLEEALLDPANAITARTLMHPDTPASTKSGFCISQLTMRRLIPASTLSFEGKLTVPAANRVVIDAKARVDGRIGAVSTTGREVEYDTPNFEVNGKLRLFDGTGGNGSQLRGVLTGTGTVEVVGLHSRTNETAGTGTNANDDLFMDFYYNKYILTSDNGNIVATGRHIFELTNAVAYVLGSLNPTPRSHASIYHLRWENLSIAGGKRLICQFQGPHSKAASNICCYVAFYNRASGNKYVDLWAKLLSAWMVPNTYPIGTDFDSLTNSVATSVRATSGSVNSEGIALRDIQLYFSTPRGDSLLVPYDTKFNNGMSGTPHFVVGGTPERTQHFYAAYSNALPSKGVVEVKEGGWLHMKQQGVDKKGYNGGDAEIIVRKGGHLLVYNYYPFSDSQYIRLDGGEMFCGIDLRNSVFGPYVEHLTLRDGASVDSLIGIKVGNRQRLSFINVCGTSPSFFKTDIIVQAGSTAATCYTNEWRVANVDGTPVADFILNGNILPYDSTTLKYTNIVIKKVGPGTARVNGQFRHYAPVWVLDGTLEFGANDSANGREFVLNGGTLTAADGTANTCAALTVGADGGTIKVNDGTTLAFADSTGAEWLGPVTLTTDDDVFPEGVLKFGADVNGLTAGQVAKMRFNGKRVHLRADGAVSAIPKGIAISIR